jgi:hypothetical protein
MLKECLELTATITRFINVSKPQSFENQRQNKGSVPSSKRGIHHRLKAMRKPPLRLRLKVVPKYRR